MSSKVDRQLEFCDFVGPNFYPILFFDGSLEVLHVIKCSV